MRSAILLSVALFLFASAEVQIASGQQAALSHAEMLRAHIEGEDGLEEELLALSPAQLHQAMVALEFPEAESGFVRNKIDCPDGYSRPCFVILPEAYDPTHAYPLLIVMHGGVLGNRAQVARGFAEHVVAGLPTGWNEKLIVMGVAANVPGTTRDAVWWSESGQANVLAALRDAKIRYNIDDDRVLLAGMSDGGSGVYAFASHNQDHFAGFYSWVGNPGIAQQFDSNVWFENLRTCPLRHVLGVQDRLHSPERIRSLVDAMQKSGAQVELQEYRQAGHDLSYLAQELEIMLENRELPTRDFFPEEIDWSTDRVEAGRHAWISIDAIGEIKDYDAGENGWLPAYPGILAMSPIQLGVTLKRGSKVIVDQVNAGSLAEELGFQSGDEIKQMDGIKIHSLDDLRDAIMEGVRGEAFTGLLMRDGENIEFEGVWPLFEANPDFARVSAQRDGNGRVDVLLHNVQQLSIWVAPEMLDADGKLCVSVNGQPVFDGKPLADTKVILTEFERTFDRKRPFTTKITLDLVKLLDGTQGGKPDGQGGAPDERTSPEPPSEKPAQPRKEEEF